VRDPESCPLCKSAASYWTTKAGRDVYRCARCGLVWVPAGLVVTDSGASIYEGDSAVFFEGGNERYYLDETNFRSCREKLAFVKRLVPGDARLLDAGSNFGHFLKVASERYCAVGVEIGEAPVRWSREKLGVENHVGSIYDLPAEVAGTYDAVTLWDVIEHVPDPRGALAALARALEPGGTLFLSTPDAGSAVARAMGRHWHYLDPVQHIVLFNRANLTHLLCEAGFEVERHTTFGHYYRVEYVLDRLRYLHGEGLIGASLRALKVLATPFSDCQVYITLRDVMGIAARKASPPK
jgi:SAM-dependent methyltransferase